jgi:hypothetical protein
MDPASPQVAERLAAFQRWFEAERASLEAEAAAQRGELEAAERAMETTMCQGER